LKGMKECYRTSIHLPPLEIHSNWIEKTETLIGYDHRERNSQTHSQRKENPGLNLSPRCMRYYQFHFLSSGFLSFCIATFLNTGVTVPWLCSQRFTVLLLFFHRPTHSTIPTLTPLLPNLNDTPYIPNHRVFSS
jgi:hypothetical protein